MLKLVILEVLIYRIRDFCICVFFILVENVFLRVSFRCDFIVSYYFRKEVFRVNDVIEVLFLCFIL